MEKNEWEIAWSEFLAVGVPAMDEEHRQFIARVNDVNRAIVDAEDKATVERLMDLMLMEATHHFWHEQQLLDKRKYPEAKEHAEKHAQLTAQFTQAMKEFQDADVSYIWAMKGLQIKQLLVMHLLREDMKYRDFLRARQVPR